MDNISESRLSFVAPELARRVRQLYDLLQADGIEMHVTCGYRNYTQQNLLYAQGRTGPGPIVTNAKAGESHHNFGLAVDVDPFIADKPDWNGADDNWKDLLSKAKTVGLKEGADWCHPDEPHLYPAEVPDSPDDNMRMLFEEGGVEAVWTEYRLKGT